LPIIIAVFDSKAGGITKNLLLSDLETIREGMETQINDKKCTISHTIFTSPYFIAYSSPYSKPGAALYLAVFSKRMEDSLGRLRAKLASSRKQRDQIQQKVLKDRSEVAQREAELARLQADFYAAKSRLQEQEDTLRRFDETVRESEVAYNKLVSNTEKLLSALDQETAQLSKFMR
jgi:septal ring factor EnvC (AmiA/AmiB activator)